MLHLRAACSVLLSYTWDSFSAVPTLLPQIVSIGFRSVAHEQTDQLVFGSICRVKSVPGECDPTVCARLCHARAFGFGWRFDSLTMSEFEYLVLCSHVTHTCHNWLQFEASTTMPF